MLVIIILVAVAWILPRLPEWSHTGYQGANDYLLAAQDQGTATATPFQPIPPTPLVTDGNSSALTTPMISASPEITVTATPKPIWGDYPGPTIWPDIDMPAPVGLLPHPDGQVNILLLGSDQRPNDGGFRTDTIQLLTINPNEKTVKLTSFPRDLYVYIPGYTVQRINTAMGWGGFEALASTMEYNFGVRPDHYVLINFWTFKDIIDAIGGITVYAGQDLCDQRDGYESYCVYQGSTWMDGETALWYVRSRYATGDIDRGRRQQEVLQALFDQLVSIDGLQRLPELYGYYHQSVTTDLDLGTLTSLLPTAIHMGDASNIGRYSIGDAQVYDWTNTNGAMVLVPIREQVLAIMSQAISQP